MRNFRFLLIIIALAGCSKTEKRIKRAEIYMKKMEPLKAISLLSSDSSARALLMLAKIHFKIDHPSEGIETVEKLCRLHPEKCKDGLKIVEEYKKKAMKSGRRYAAVQCILTLKKLDPDYKGEEDLKYLGDYYYDREDYEDAVQYYEEWLLTDSTDIDTRLKLARAFQKLGNLENAYSVLKNGEKINGGWEVRYELGKVSFLLGKKFFKEGNYVMAEEFLKETIRIGLPEVLIDDAYFLLGDIAFSKNDSRQAEIYYRKVIDLNRFSSNAIVRKAQKRIELCNRMGG